MNITQITVSIHEKRNHPHEYGHYDAEVRYTADVLPDEDILKRTKELQFLAGSFVAEKCEQWIKVIELNRLVNDISQTFRRRLNHAVYSDDEAEMERRLADLDAWALEQIDNIGISTVGDLRIQIDPARQKWHEHYSRQRGQQDDDASGDGLEQTEANLPF